MRCLCLLLALGGIVCITAVKAPPTLRVDLSLPAEKRWEGAVDAVLNTHSYEDSFLPAFREHNATLFDHFQLDYWSRIAHAVRKHYPEQAAELQSFSEQFAQAGYYVSYEYLAAWAYFHEFAHTDLLSPSAKGIAAECSAVLVRDMQGNVLHGANMDQSPSSVRNVTLHVTFTSGSDVLFEGVDWYWFNAGVTRAVRGGVASLQENWRHSDAIPHEQVMQDIERGVTSQVWVFRSLLEHPPATFDLVVKHLETVRLASPFYVAVGGPSGDGAIITRNNTGSVETVRFKDNDEWFLVHSNYDRWEPDPEDDPRRTVGQDTMRNLGRVEGASLLGLFAVTSTFPVHNPHTAYTALMDPKSGAFHSYVREALCPEGGPAANEGTRYCQPVPTTEPEMLLKLII